MSPTGPEVEPAAARGPEAPQASSEGPVPRRFRHLRTVSAPLDLGIERLRRLLPEPLVPSSPTARVTFGQWDDEVVGEHTGAGVYVPARVAGEEGAYVAAMFVDSDRSLIVGRELFGEAKFLGVTDLRFHEDRVALEVAREGTRLSLHGTLGGAARPGRETRRSFNLKAHLTTDGTQTTGEPILTATDWEADLARVVTGRARLRVTCAHDSPLGIEDDLESEVEFTLSEGVMEGRTRHVSPIDPERVVPFLRRRLGLDG